MSPREDVCVYVCVCAGFSRLWAQQILWQESIKRSVLNDARQRNRPFPVSQVCVQYPS